MTSGLQVEVEIDLAGHPLVVEFGEQGGDEAQAGIGIGEDAGDAGAPAQFPVDAFQAIGGAQPHAMGRWEVEHGQTLGNGCLGPFGQFRVLLAPRLEGQA